MMVLVVKKKGHRANSSEVKQREKDSLADRFENSGNLPEMG